MTYTRWRVWLVGVILLFAVPVSAGPGPVADCSGQTEGTECVDNDGNPCTLAACDEEGECDQQFDSAPEGTTCPDLDGEPICSIPAGCDGDGRCVENPVTPGTPCPDIDDNVCTIASCSPSGACSQDRNRAPEGTECPDTDGLSTTHPGCVGRDCVQTFRVDGGFGVPALSTAAVASLAIMLMGLGFWQVRRRSRR
jgi:hypothetical protein